jgi:tRNA/rRNA methyltransferase
MTPTNDMTTTSPFDNIVVVLCRPQKLVNIAGAIRAMKNMGLRRLRLVQPAEYDTYDIEGIAHRSADVLGGTTLHDTLDAALADTIYVVGTTARVREVAARLETPRALAIELLARAEQGSVALLFGPEDNGLTNQELDRCHCLLTIPTNPSYRSLNLGQAVLIAAYELWLAREQASSSAIEMHAMARRAKRPANAAQLEELFGALERALWGIEFFKAHQAAGMMRTLRSLVHRAEPDVREAALLKAIAMETLSFLRRKGITPESQDSAESGEI